MATWTIRSKTNLSRRRKISFLSLQTQEGWCTIGSRHQQTHVRITLFSHDGEDSSMGYVFPSLQRLKNSCLDALSSRLARWMKPIRTSLPLSTLTDLGKSKSQLIAENALLRQQLIMLKRQVKRPPVSSADRILLILLARLVRNWQQAHITRATRNPAQMASGALSLVLEAQVQGFYSQAEGRCRNDCLDQRDGDEQSASSALKGFAENS
jgi:hypothetical protein